MVVTELSPEQIIGLLTGIGGAVAVIITAARQSAKGGGGSVERVGNAGGPALLVLDAKQVQNLVDQMGLLVAAMAENRIALGRNSEIAHDVQEEAEKLVASFHQLTIEVARRPIDRG